MPSREPVAPRTPRPLVPRATTVGVAVVCLLGLGGCTEAGHEPALAAAPVDGRDDALEVTFSGCEPEPTITVVETDEVVRVSISGPNGECEPLFWRVVELDAPVGARRIIDNATGDELPPALE